MTDKENKNQLDTGLLEETETQLIEPKMYKVILLNDDYTPMDFVIEVLQKFFDMDEQKATQIMLHVHTRGQGLCGIFTHEVAETKTAQVNEYARDNEHPLLCVAEIV
ncbi:ATP-dependent Clp protease adapter ClpS [Marinicella litoralis]|uniref:ATP-dependent Clp protease adapter protein ClpS n=1 Tax=Marinicella litoralis TaxID=644220 RepID=A0A4R6Y173_9GAMM|nr:ATP-dependent Clp protease adapter ClpS [Marinicella litoralis]TDR22698.1 ATP-dependent Clp protease adaptor protein ClpS [Marinicella litoralis]